MLTGTWFDEMFKFIERINVINVNISNEEKPEAIILDNLTTRYDDFDYKMIEEYKKFIIQLKLKARDKRILIFGSKRVLQYSINLIDLYEPIEIPSDWRGVMMLKAHGRYAEGVDIPADIVVMLGCPFYPPEVISRLAKIYSRMGFKDSWNIGRAKRNSMQKPKIILADERYNRYLNELSRYLEVK